MSTQNLTKLVIVTALALAITFGSVVFADGVGESVSSSPSVQEVATFHVGTGGGGC